MSASDRRIILVSGGSRGLGLAITESLLDAGDAVATFSRKATQPINDLLGRFPSRLSFLEADMSDFDSLERLVALFEQEAGPIAALINNAGMALDGLLATMPGDHVDKMLAVNLAGTLHLTRSVLRRMIPRRRGSIISISSIIGLRGYSGLAAYSATKAGLDGMTRALAREVGTRNIRVNSIAPGYLETEMSGGLDSRQRDQIIRRTPLARLGRPSDVTGAARFLLSEEAGFITGQTLVIDGGITC